MAIIQFDDGTQVEVQGNPTPADIDYIHSQIKANSQTPNQVVSQSNDATDSAERYGIDQQNALGQVSSDYQDIAQRYQSGETNLPSALLQGAGASARGVFGQLGAFLKNTPIVGNAINMVQNNMQTPSVTANLAPEGGVIANSPTVQNLVSSEPADQIANFLDQHKDIGRNAQSAVDLANLATLKPGAEVANVAVDASKPLVNTAIDATKGAVDNLTNQTEESINNYITQTFDKAVKPSITSKGSLSQAENYQNSVVDAVKTIAGNKDNLTFNTDGVPETGRLPQSLEEFSQAIDQTKRKIYDLYSALSSQAGEAGGTVDLGKIASNLDEVIGNKALQISNPEAIKYAQDLKDRFVKAGTLDVKTAEQVIQNYNQDLQAFYRNPTYETASRAAVTAGVVNNLRADLDRIIENLTGSQYQPLKNKYAALKTIEKDVLKRATVDARKNMRGLLDYSDIFTGGQMVHGLLTLNPAQFATGVFERGMKAYFKYLNDPNVGIQRLFEKVDKYQTRNPKALLPSKPSQKLKTSP